METEFINITEVKRRHRAFVLYYPHKDGSPGR